MYGHVSLAYEYNTSGAGLREKAPPAYPFGFGWIAAKREHVLYSVCTYISVHSRNATAKVCISSQ